MEGFCFGVDSVCCSLLIEPLHCSTFRFEFVVAALEPRRGPPPRTSPRSSIVSSTAPRDERKDQDDVAVAAPGARAASGAASAAAGPPRLRPPRPGARRRRSTRRPCPRATTLTRPSATSTTALPTSSPGCSSRAWSTCARATRPRSRSPPSEAIARRVFPHDSSPEYLAIPHKHYACRVRNRLRCEVQVPLRKVLELPVVYMSACKWDELPYARVASTAMRQYKEASWMVLLSSDHGVGDGGRKPGGLAEKEGEDVGIEEGSYAYCSFQGK
ncbi:uncharacterized protein LOC119281579 [Triticum dicoccoides]|uniref:uncharacterized protein LOC119281579 n=1 Tax=Triticum dicoccoides TaxID=85692 RepID=UPI00188ED713|nr:uncharacterized protein LOC119281579 [Triticum dicoccoides]